ncbi:MAG: Trk system potassium transporter TrkA [Muribaculaceae bacterium]|nr:Trk system potassium transporter TrkA [Muribaculaceae bacterium]
MKVIILGAGAIGVHLANLFSKIRQDIIVIDEDQEKLERIQADSDLMTIHSSANTPVQALKDAHVNRADLFIAVTRDENLNLSLCVLAKSMGARQTVAKVENAELSDPQIIDVFRAAGISSIIDPDNLAALDIVNGLKLTWARQRWDVHGGLLTLLGIKVRESCKILGQPFKEIFKPDSPYHVVAIKRNNLTIMPSGDDRLLPGDFVYFMTTRDYVPNMRIIMGKDNYPDVKNVFIVGGGKTAVRVVNMLSHDVKAKIFENDPRRCEELIDLVDTSRVMVINADGRSVANLMEENIKAAQAFVALTGNAEANILACLTAKQLGVRKTIAMIENLDYMDIAGNVDIGTIINKQALTASHIYQMLLNGDVRNMRNLMIVNADVAEFTARPGSRITRKKVRELDFPSEAELGGLVRDGKGILVNGETQILPGDIVVVFCHGTEMSRIEKFFI